MSRLPPVLKPRFGKLWFSYTTPKVGNKVLTDIWPTPPKSSWIMNHQVIYIIGEDLKTNELSIIARFTSPSDDIGPMTSILINSTHIRDDLIESYSTVATLINHLLLGCIMGDTLQQHPIHRVDLFVEDPTRLPWSELGFKIRKESSGLSFASREYRSPDERDEIHTGAPSFSKQPEKKAEHALQLVPDPHTHESNWGPPTWEKGRQLAQTGTLEDCKASFSRLRKDIPCPMCQGHYCAFWNAHPIDVYLRKEEQTGTLFSITAWFNQCHNNVNVMNYKAVWYVQ